MKTCVDRPRGESSHLAALYFDPEQRVHHQPGVAWDQSIGPIYVVLVELDGLVNGQLRVGEEGELLGLAGAGAVALDSVNDCLGADPLVDV